MITTSRRLLVITICFLSLFSHAQAQTAEELLEQQKDARLYLEMIDILKDAPIEDQIAGWEKFLKQNPNNYFKEEIRTNLENIRARRSIQEKKREEEDSRVYFQAVEQATKLSIEEQVQLWQDFLKKNPDNLFAGEARTTLNRLKEELRWNDGQARTKQPPKEPVAQSPPAVEVEVVNAGPESQEQVEFLDPDRALLLAALPGLVVPGLGHFYANSYAMGAFLAAMRVVGLLFVLGGAFEDSNGFIVPGLIITGSSYFLDVWLAPERVHDYNEKVVPIPSLDDKKLPTTMLHFEKDGVALSLNPSALTVRF